MTDEELEASVAPPSTPVIVNTDTTQTTTRRQQTTVGTVVDDRSEKPMIRWKNRRQMAWCAFWAMIAMTLILWFLVPLIVPFGLVNIVSESMAWFYMAMTAIILAYMGFTTIPFMGRGRNSSRVDQDDL